eukprot:jgi/Astpho2/6657/fgenesh1_pg.00101_%23_46_t
MNVGSAQLPTAHAALLLVALPYSMFLQMKKICFPSTVLRERFGQMQYRPLAAARQRQGSEGKWGTVAVLTEKLKPKESASGRAFSMWRLSDLQGTNLSLFLFGRAHEESWKDQFEGAVVAVWGPQCKTDEEGRFSFSVSTCEQVTRLGQSTSFGFCRARRKDGMPCRNPVNVDTCPYCDYHVGSEFKKVQSKRGQFAESKLHSAFKQQGGKGLSGAKLGTKRLRMTENGEVLVARQQTMKLHSSQDLLQVAQRGQPGSLGARMLQAQASHADTVPRAKRVGSSVPPQQAATSHCSPAAGGGSRPPSQPAASQPASRLPSAGRPLVLTRREGGTAASRAGGGALVAGRQTGSGQGDVLVALEDGDDEAGWDAATAEVLAVIRAKGGLEAPDPNNTRPVLRKPPVTQDAPAGTGSLPAAALTKRGFAAAFGSLAGVSNEGSKSRSRYHDLVDDEEHDRLLKTLAVLEKKDEMAQRMEAVTKLQVTAWQCKTCNYIAESFRPECKGHQLARLSATKRWWQCRHCSHKFSTVGVRLPKGRCPRCNDPHPDFKAASMKGAPKPSEVVDQAIAQQSNFQSRGREHSFALGSSV